MKYLLVLILFFSVTNAVNVTIFTKNFAPFSYDSEGFSIDYVNKMLVNIYGVNLNTNIQVLEDNAEIFDALIAFNDTTENYAIGTSGITITKDREAIVNFLPPFFRSGLQVMTHSDSSWSTDVVNTISAVSLAFVGFGIALVILIYTITPIVWLFEMGYSGDKIPIFIDIKSRKNHSPYSLYGYNIKFITPKIRTMISEIQRTAKWTALSLFGTQTGYPNNTYAQYIHSMLKASTTMFIILATATFTNVIDKATNVTNINSYNNLNGHSVCTVTGSTSESFLMSNNIGFTLYHEDSVDQMFNRFWNKGCDAVVYDFPSLRNSIALHSEQEVNIIDGLLNEEYYGIAINEHNPNEELLKQGVIQLNSDYNIIQSLEEKWFRELDELDSKTDSNYPSSLFIIPSVTGISILILAFIWLYKKYDSNTEKYIALRTAKYDRDYRNDYNELHNQEQENEDIFRGQDWLIDQRLVPQSQRILRIAYERELRFRGHDISHDDKDEKWKNVDNNITTSDTNVKLNDIHIPTFDEIKNNEPIDTYDDSP